MISHDNDSLVRWSDDVSVWLERTWNLARARPVCLWGAGEAGARMARYCSEAGFPVAALVDGSSEKQGRRVLDLTVFGPAQLHSSFAAKQWFVVICSVYRAEITRSLVDMGLQEGRDFVDAGEIPSRLPPDLEGGGRLPVLDPRKAIEEAEMFEARRQELMAIKRLSRSRPIYVWGTGPHAHQVTRDCRGVGCPVDGYIEREVSLQGRRMNGVFVFSPGSVRSLDSGTYRPLVILAPVDVASASELLRAMGLCQGADFFIVP